MNGQSYRPRKVCQYCGGTVIRGRVIAANGAAQVRDICQSCGRNTVGKGINIPHRFIHDLDSLPILEDYTPHSEPCSVHGCPEKFTEYHHWAPRYLFSDECEDWPGNYLCTKHHRQWHATVTPEMAKRAA